MPGSSGVRASSSSSCRPSRLLDDRGRELRGTDLETDDLPAGATVAAAAALLLRARLPFLPKSSRLCSGTSRRRRDLPVRVELRQRLQLDGRLGGIFGDVARRRARRRRQVVGRGDLDVCDEVVVRLRPRLRSVRHRRLRRRNRLERDLHSTGAAASSAMSTPAPARRSAATGSKAISSAGSLFRRRRVGLRLGVDRDRLERRSPRSSASSASSAGSSLSRSRRHGGSSARACRTGPSRLGDLASHAARRSRARLLDELADSSSIGSGPATRAGDGRLAARPRPSCDRTRSHACRTEPSRRPPARTPTGPRARPPGSSPARPRRTASRSDLVRVVARRRRPRSERR